ncbi:hypothetical protein VSDG_10020 [Cytospora chrysosperma]|uniref:Uncharacterized protein n=1 Tax=Cytospora chrysosperma TaxID=252740 RepID=A0A423V885_CYTCH|nr:hypothetical protein VSDG_10020 [Valsa sordida]
MTHNNGEQWTPHRPSVELLSNNGSLSKNADRFFPPIHSIDNDGGNSTMTVAQGHWSCPTSATSGEYSQLRTQAQSHRGPDLSRMASSHHDRGSTHGRETASQTPPHIPRETLTAASSRHGSITTVIEDLDSQIDDLGDTEPPNAERGDSRRDVDYDDNNDDQSFQGSLHIAAELGHESIVAMLLAAGVAADEPDSEGNTPLHRAAQSRKLNVALKLLKNGADPNSVNKAGWTPVHFAVSTGSPVMLDLLVRHGGDLTKKARRISG